MSQETIDRVNQVVGGFDQRVQAVGDTSWGNASPCEAWTARDVVGHVIGNLRRVSAGLGGPAPVELSADEDIRAAWNTTRDGFTGLVATADLSANMDGPFGPMPAEQLVGRIITTDVLVHTWDLARAVGGDESLPEDLIEGAYSGLKPMDAMIRRPGVFSDKIESAAGADLQTEFLCFLGRKV
jgi:uncharacterized protein (TIGR03086 family)